MPRNCSVVIPAWVTPMMCAQSCSVSLPIASRSPPRTALKGSSVFHSGWSGASCFKPIEREHGLRVERVLGPQRAVLVEGGDAVFGGHEPGRVRGRRLFHEREDARLRGALVPRGQRIGLPLRRLGQRASGPREAEAARERHRQRDDEGTAGNRKTRHGLLPGRSHGSRQADRAPRHDGPAAVRVARRGPTRVDSLARSYGLARWTGLRLAWNRWSAPPSSPWP